jgi:hypothetical protein
MTNRTIKLTIAVLIVALVSLLTPILAEARDGFSVRFGYGSHHGNRYHGHHGVIIRGHYGNRYYDHHRYYHYPRNHYYDTYRYSHGHEWYLPLTSRYYVYPYAGNRYYWNCR